MSDAGSGGPSAQDASGGAPKARPPRQPRPVRAPYFPADEDTDRHRRIVSSSPLKRIEEEERELQRRQESARYGLRLTVMGLIVLVAFSAVVVRLWSLQVLHSSHYRNAALVYQDRAVPITPTRGLIIARGGQVLVGDQVLPVVTLSRATATPAVVGRLAALLGESVAQVNTALANPQASVYQPVPIAIGVSQSTIVYLSEHKTMFPGVDVSFTAERTYPFGDTAAQVLGYIGDIDAAQLRGIGEVRLHAERRHRPVRRRGVLRTVAAGAARFAGHQGRRPRQPGRDRVDHRTSQRRRRRAQHRRQPPEGGRVRPREPDCRRSRLTISGRTRAQR